MTQSKRLARRAIPALALAALVTLHPTTARAADFDLPNFSDTSSLTLNGDAAAVNTNLDGAVLRVAPSLEGQRGSAFTNSTYDLSAGFSTFFTFRLHTWDQIGFGGADGFTFVMQADPRGASALGDGGEPLGYGAYPDSPNAIVNSAAIEFDTFQNNPEDRNSNHIALDINGNVTHSTNPADPTYPVDAPNNLRNMRQWFAWIDYDGATIQVRLAQDGPRPTDPTLSAPLSLSGQYHIGFTASTGSGTEHHDVSSWSFVDSHNPFPGIAANFSATSNGPYITSLPEPVASWHDPLTWNEAEIPANITDVTLEPADAPYIVQAASDARAQSLRISGFTSGITQNNTTLLVSNGATLSVAELLSIGDQSQSDASLHISDPGSTVEVYGDLTVGNAYYSTTSLTLDGGARLTNFNARVNTNNFSTATALITGGSEWISRGELVIGDFGPAEVTVADGSLLRAYKSTVGRFAFDAVLTVQGAGSRFEVQAELNLADNGNAFLNVLDGAAVTVASTFGMSGGATLTVADPDSSFTADQSAFSDGLIDVYDSGQTTFNGGIEGNSTILVSTGGIVTANYVRALALELHPGGRAVIPASSFPTTSSVGQLIFTDDGTLDLNDNRIAVTDASDPDLADTLRHHISTAYNNGDWAGPGLTSTVAGEHPDLLGAIGYATAEELLGTTPDGGTWNGVSVLPHSVILTYTFFGDANLNGVIDPDDFALLDRGLALDLTGWINGDFNYDNLIDSADALLLDRTASLLGHPVSPDFLAARAAQFGPDYVSTLTASIPEPTLALSSILYPLSLLFLRRRAKANRR